MAPLDPESIIAVGKLTESPTIVRAFKEFDAAFRRIRAIHSAIGRRVNQAIRQSFIVTGKRAAPIRSELEEHLELPLEELLEAIDLAEVVAIDNSPVMIAQNEIERVIGART